MSDTELWIARALDGDRSALEVVFRRHRRRLVPPGPRRVQRSLESTDLRMRVYVESDRAVALRETQYDVLWYGKIDASVPFEFVR
jgi:hypothetical protein